MRALDELRLRPMARRRALGLLAALIGCACATSSPPRPSQVVSRDESGFTITEKVRVSEVSEEVALLFGPRNLGQSEPKELEARQIKRSKEINDRMTVLVGLGGMTQQEHEGAIRTKKQGELNCTNG